MVKPGRPGAAKGKKGPLKGTGGKNRRSLEGKGPTPKAEDRSWHVAGKRKAVYLFKSTRSATRGFKFVRKVYCNGYGAYKAGSQKPARTTWYVCLYAADSWYWEALTPTVKVTVR